MTHPLTPRENLTRPIIGIENRTAQEVFDIMSDRFHSHLTALASGSGDHAELSELREHRITADLLVSTLKADKAEAERKLAEAVGHVTRLADWIEHEVGAELPYSEGEEDARAFLSKEAERG